MKFSRDPSSKGERDAIEKLVKSEADKINALKERGAKAYYLLTNIRGTSFPDQGSIDRTNEALTSALQLPSYCWWRDDLDARINGDSDVKWSFPEIIKGSDVLQLLVETSNRENAESRLTAVRAYIASQFSDDEQVKFKQVELQNKLLDLFVDLPIKPVRASLQSSRFAARGESYQIADPASERLIIDEHILDGRHDDQRLLLAARMLLLYPLNGTTNRIVLEGAPGQGKSTITQFICQVNRIRFLNKSLELASIAETGPIRLPFRVDLRDYASWLTGRNPFSSEPASASSPQQPSLESFLAAQISYTSGGHDFSVSDFSALAKTSHLLIVLDGFDEVADIALRKRIVDEITKAATRIHANARSALIIVTSRPSAFANSPGFPDDQWVHLEIQAMAAPQVSEYASKWMTARRLSSRDRADFEKFLDEKLEQPHMRDLARNPMQLTILLALIHTRGLSLPDKRTALYDSYMELFFNREAEKSRVVREHRDLLIDIHRFLAWKLHSQAEKGNSSGSITESDLRSLLEKYLKSEGHKTELVQELFTGMVERVVALVSRVQGTFEFEVQPLREYFAARHLYDTAPYSPPGNERKGTKIERFNALARNFYWLNVVRFFCGCFSKGELSALADCLAELSQSQDFELISHPRLLSLMLLSDWVFSQQPLAVQRVLETLFTEPGLKIALAGDTPGGNTRFSLPENCGRGSLIARCYEILARGCPSDVGAALLAIIRENSTLSERAKYWLEHWPAEGGLSAWLRQGQHLQVFEFLPQIKVDALADKFELLMLPPLVNSQRFDAVYAKPSLFDAAVSGILEQGYLFWPRGDRGVNSLEQLSILLNPQTYRSVFEVGRGMPAKFAVTRVYGPGHFDISEQNSDKATLPTDVKIRVLGEKLRPALEEDVAVWNSTTAPWQALVDETLNAFGPSWAVAKIAVLSAAIRSTNEPGVWNKDEWDIGPQLCGRVRHARLKSGNISWWRERFSAVATCSEQSRALAILTFLIWATPRTIHALTKEVIDEMARLSDSYKRQVFDAAREILWALTEIRRPDEGFELEPSVAAQPELAIILAKRGTDAFAENIFMKIFRSYRGQNPTALEFMSQTAFGLAARKAISWEDALPDIHYAYRHGQNVPTTYASKGDMPRDQAAMVSRSAVEYPNEIIRIAQRTLNSEVGSRAKKSLISPTKNVGLSNCPLTPSPA